MTEFIIDIRDQIRKLYYIIDFNYDCTNDIETKYPSYKVHKVYNKDIWFINIIMINIDFYEHIYNNNNKLPKFLDLYKKISQNCPEIYDYSLIVLNNDFEKYSIIRSLYECTNIYETYEKFEYDLELLLEELKLFCNNYIFSKNENIIIDSINNKFKNNVVWSGWNDEVAYESINKYLS